MRRIRDPWTIPPLWGSRRKALPKSGNLESGMRTGNLVITKTDEVTNRTSITSYWTSARKSLTLSRETCRTRKRN